MKKTFQQHTAENSAYNFVVDLDERGSFRCHVEHAKSGKVVFSANNEDENGNEGAFWLTEDGFMRHTKDMDGLLSYLVQMGVLSARATLRYIG